MNTRHTWYTIIVTGNIWPENSLSFAKLCPIKKRNSTVIKFHAFSMYIHMYIYSRTYSHEIIKMKKTQHILQHEDYDFCKNDVIEI